jgi:hypothetical protein
VIHPTAIIGDPPESRDYWFDETASTFPPFIHHSARVHAFVSVDAGMRRPTHIGERTWLGKHVHIGHDAVIGSECELAPWRRDLRPRGDRQRRPDRRERVRAPVREGRRARAHRLPAPS